MFLSRKFSLCKLNVILKTFNKIVFRKATISPYLYFIIFNLFLPSMSTNEPGCEQRVRDK